MKKIFTKRFFELSPIDPEDDRKAERQIERIRKKAVAYGVFAEEEA